MLLRYNASHVQALFDLYPEIGLKRERFYRYLGVKYKKWGIVETRREFFDELAKKRGHDSRDTFAWYNITKKDVVAAGGSGLLNHYQCSVKKALISLYPNIGLVMEAFNQKKVKTSL